MKAIQLFIKVIIKTSQISVRTLDHPVRHHLFGNVDVIPQEFLADPVKGKRIYILGIHDTCHVRDLSMVSFDVVWLSSANEYLNACILLETHSKLFLPVL